MTHWVSSTLGTSGELLLWFLCTAGLVWSIEIEHHRQKKADERWQKEFGDKGREELIEFLKNQKEEK